MTDPWFVLVELHTAPGGARALPAAGEPLRSASEHTLRAARGRGYRTAVVTVDRGYYAGHFDDLVDAWLDARTTDPVAVRASLRRLGPRVAAVHSSVDSFVRVAARVAADLGLPGPAPDGAGIARDKATARRALADAGVERVRWAVLPAADRAARSPIGYPCVVKPVDGAYSWDVALVSGDRELRALADRHLRRRYPRGVRPRHDLIVEEYLAGPLYSAEGFVDGDELTIFGYSDRVLSPPPHFVELALRFSGERPDRGADDYVRRCLAALDYGFGPFHLEFVLTPAGPRLVELNARLVGAGMEQAIGYVLSVPPAEFVVAGYAGERPEVRVSGAVTELYLTAPGTGVLHDVAGLDAAVAHPACRSAGLYHARGEAVTDVVESNGEYVGYVHATGRSREDSYRDALAAAGEITLGVGAAPTGPDACATRVG